MYKGGKAVVSVAENVGHALKTGSKAAVEGGETVAKSGVYHIQGKNKMYTGSSGDMDKRLSNPKHPAAPLLKEPGVVVEKNPVDISHLRGADRTRALRVVEQDVMDVKGNSPGSDTSLNRVRALTEKKQELYRPLLDQ